MDQYKVKLPTNVAPQQVRQTEHQVRVRPGGSRRTKKLLIAMAIIVIALLLAAAGAYKFMYKQDNASIGLVGVNANDYQSLFLTNGQVYFGKLKAADDKTVEMRDIYYLQVQQTVQPRPNTASNNTAAEQQQGETQLVKLGQELHGPKDEMYIDRGQVLFWENLKGDGKVVTAINEHKKK